MVLMGWLTSRRRALDQAREEAAKMRARYGSDAAAICQQIFIRTADDQDRVKLRRALQMLASEDRSQRASGTRRQPIPLQVQADPPAEIRREAA